tara:strand:+ start:204 stop:1034 length:831 start_codon:yes stop_codon:yes gene_type:complete
MKVLKFGGGCLKDVNSIKKLPIVLQKYTNGPVFLVLSAFGKTTNMLEKHQYNDVVNYTRSIMLELDFEIDVVQKVLDKYLKSKNNLQLLNYPSRVCIGEYISSEIIHRYLFNIGIANKLIDASLCIWTGPWDSELNSAAFHSAIFPETMKNKINTLSITQGFIASDIQSKQNPANILRTTLGREGSDYSAAIFGKLLNASEVVLFKDVDGVYDKDPKIYHDATLLSKLSYNQAFQICNRENTVIHPNTLQHLRENKIPIRIKNFNNLSKKGSFIID